MARSKKSQPQDIEQVEEAPAKVAVSEPKEVKIIVPEADSKKETTKKMLAKLIAEETRTVKGRFRCFETPESACRIQIKKYKEVPMFDKWMTDGLVYEVPMYVANFLNGVDKTAKAIGCRTETCSYPVHAWKWQDQFTPPKVGSMDGSGPNGEPGIAVPIAGITKRVRRYGFESLEFDMS